MTWCTIDSATSRQAGLVSVREASSPHTVHEMEPVTLGPRRFGMRGGAVARLHQAGTAGTCAGGNRLLQLRCLFDSTGFGDIVPGFLPMPWRGAEVVAACVLAVVASRLTAPNPATARLPIAATMVIPASTRLPLLWVLMEYSVSMNVPCSRSNDPHVFCVVT